MRMQARTKFNMKGIYFVLASSSIFVTLCLMILSTSFNGNALFAAANGDYRSKATGNWSATTTWEFYNGTSWVAATGTPTSADGIITIQSGHTVTVTVSISVDQVTVDPGGALSVFSGKNLTIANGTGDDLTVNGTVTINGTLTNQGSTNMELSGLTILKNGGANTFASNATINVNSGGRYRAEDASMTVSSGHWIVKSGGVYQHNLNAATLPVAAWNSGSTCEVSGVVSTLPSGLNQAFANFIWDCPSQTSIENLQGKLIDVNENLTLLSTGTGSVRLSQTENYTLNIGGNLYVQGGYFYATCKSTSCIINISGDFIQTGGTFTGSDSRADQGQGSPTINLTGNFDISAGTFDFNQYTANGNKKGVTTLNLNGNFTQTGGTINVTTSNGGIGDVYFTKTGTQLFSKTSGTISNKIYFTVNSTSTLDLNTSIITSTGDFTLLANGELIIGSSNGITQSSASGNIQVTGSRTYSTAGSYTYNGSVAQATGDGLPSTIKNLTINNSNNITLTNTASVSSTMTFSAGNIFATNDTLILGTSTSILGTLARTSGHVIGKFKRWVGATTFNILIPVGAAGYYEGINYNYTTAPSVGGSITALYTATDPGKNGFNLYDASDTINTIGYSLWTSTDGDGLTGGVFDVDITATSLPGVLDYTKLHLLRRANSGSVWTVPGTHSAGSGSNSIPIVHRTGLTVHGQYGIGSNTTNPLPIELLYFNPKLYNEIVKLSWSTASELNNDYFIVERSSDGNDFAEVIRKNGAGNSTSILFYSDEDTHPLTGYNYYRLKQIDFDGHFSYSKIETVYYNLKPIDGDELQILSVAPNPFSDNLNLNFLSKRVVSAEIMLVNSSGQTIFKDKIQTNEGLNSYQFSSIKVLSKGIYFVYLLCNDQKIIQKIINE